MPVSQFCWEEGKTWENGYYLLSAVAEAISSIMANLEMAKNIYTWKWENFLSLDMKNILLFGYPLAMCDKLPGEKNIMAKKLGRRCRSQ